MPATTEIYTLSLHDALPILAAVALGLRRRAELAQCHRMAGRRPGRDQRHRIVFGPERRRRSDRKSTRLNSSHANISYAVFCLKKKKKRVHSGGGVRLCQEIE